MRRRAVTRLVALVALAGLVLTSCGLFGGGDTRTYHAMFDRAVQLFPGGAVRVMGVDIGIISDVQNVADGVRVTFLVDDPELRLPAEVEAALVPISLLGERYVQLFPAYEGGPELEDGATIPASRTAVPSEPDELLRSLQDYLGALDPAAVEEFVTNAATALRGYGDELNGLIGNATGVMSTLAKKRDDLATIIVEFDKLTRALSTRKEGLARLINSYNDVAHILTDNRESLEGTIDGLTQMSTELASLLIAHRDPLHRDIESFTRTGRTLRKNIESLARTGHWAKRLFDGASRGIDFGADWLRLNNQGAELEALILARLEARLIELCTDLGIPDCGSARYWEERVPSMFCFEAACRQEAAAPEEQLSDAIAGVPELVEALIEQAAGIACEGTISPEACAERRMVVVECLRADDARACLRRHHLPVRCLDARRPARCLERRLDQELEEAVGGLIDGALGLGGRQ
ncbi:MAG TPA: MlaD family protein [Actinomycetota bacterium]